MKRTQGIAALVAGALILLALLTVFAIQLSDNQSTSRRTLETQAHQRAQLVSGLISAVFEQQAHVGLDARAALSADHVSARALDDAPGDKRYAALLDSGGRVITHSSGFDARERAELDPLAAVRTVAGGRRWGIGDVRPGGVVNIVARIDGRNGERVLVTGVPLASLSQFTTSELRKVPGAVAAHQLLVDGRGVVVGSTNAQRPPGYVFQTPAQRHALSHGAGVVNGPTGARYFDQVPLAGTSWRLLLTVPAGEFFASVSGLRHYLPWMIFVAFGLVAIVALVLVRRSIRAAERIRVANARLTAGNAELNSAHVRLEQVNDALAVSNHALERSNDELERQARELVRSNAELDQFASIASHDLQEPLRKVRTFTERISETEADNLSERGADYLRRANASAERMQTLIEDLLRFSRVSTQGHPFSSVDLGRVAENVLDDLSELVGATGARVLVGPLPTINADPPQMRQLMQNLISNALKFRRQGVTPEVHVEATVQSGWATITVRDNGIGFEPQYSRRIFRVFERLHGRGTYPGTGIGLALCRKIAERHGGTATAHGVPDEGSTFTVTVQTQRREAVSYTTRPGGGAAPPAPPGETAGASAPREELYVPA